MTQYKTDFEWTRQQFDLPEGMIYLNGNSLGPMPRASVPAMTRFLNDEWRTELIKGWNTKNWFMQTNTLGDRIGRLIGAPAGSTLVSDTLSIKVFQAVAAGMAMVPDRKVILSDNGNFPTDLYMVEGLMKLKDAGYEMRKPDPEDVMDQITEDVGVVMLTEVDYRTGRRHDMKAIIDKAHALGAVVVWDLAHSAGAVPVDVGGCDVDFAVGCTYKYLNGGPGAPAFIHVAPRLLDTVEPFLSGWYGHEAPFAFDTAFRPMPGKIERMRIGTPSIASFALLSVALDIWDKVDMDDLQTRSAELCGLFIREIEARCPGLDLITPRDPKQRGSHVSFAFEHGYACMQALIADNVIGDFRAPNVMRFGITPLFVSEDDIIAAVDKLEKILKQERWKDPQFQKRSLVT
ncbi:kynureninase [Roseobacter denitrificans]|uniref:Kynureninase n=1 Tax=Roseobacter denitrificans (strain ATCC 33942 / OCh 114) TaxID=375451 RepID=Q162H4_ROSDO|nr:kynureninase [Roseobacter denitrificans]ABG33119.1 kynureninase, putative [Roseobacter denitrificans OCh 114]AVL52486.1 kynureninase [Roseobacter denitrificans]SFG07614.1 Kynureninase [Roseobacter denitrificans OCh 114]